MSKIDYEIINHGWMCPDYFQGCGVSFTRFTHVYTGCGNNAKEAYDDALEQAYQCGEIDRAILDKLPTRPHGIRARDKVPANIEEAYYFVSVRLRVEKEVEVAA